MIGLLANHRHWQTTTFVDVLRHDRITAPMVLDGPMNGPAFHAHVEQVLRPPLQPGDIVVLDNLPARKTAAVRQTVEASGAEFPRPPALLTGLESIAGRQTFDPISSRDAAKRRRQARRPSPGPTSGCRRRRHERSTTSETPSAWLSMTSFTGECRNDFQAAGDDLE